MGPHIFIDYLWALALISMGGHISVACSTHFSIAKGPWGHTIAPHTASSTCPQAYILP